MSHRRGNLFLVAPLLLLTLFLVGCPKRPVTTVAAALEAADDTHVVLEGQIVKRLQDELYEFKDGTGTIQVEIDDEDWPGQSVSENAKVRLTGEVDKDFNSREIDVDRVELIN